MKRATTEETKNEEMVTIPKSEYTKLTKTAGKAKQRIKYRLRYGNDKTEICCGMCADFVVSMNSRCKCIKCGAPICRECKNSAVRQAKSRWSWKHAHESVGLCFHPNHPYCFTHETLSKIRKEANDVLTCEVCDHLEMKEQMATQNDKEDSVDMFDDERPKTQEEEESSEKCPCCDAGPGDEIGPCECRQ